MARDSDLLFSVYNIYFSEIVWITGFDLLDFWQNLKRHVFAPRAKTQEDMNNHMSGSKLDLSDQYTVRNSFLIIFSICFFC